MVKQTIQIFCRIKPTKGKKALYELQQHDAGDQIVMTVPRDEAVGYVNNKKEEYRFRFDKIFDQNCLQDDIFESVAEPVIDNVIAGYNGTIFAYGQTGSGKTFTITGGPEKYADRGIIPRTITYFFEQFAKRPEFMFSMHVSYLELYNESGYDLLDQQHQATKLEDLPKVQLMEDDDNNIHLKNLSIHQANNEEEALNLLFLGDTNRMIAETPMNMASTRSHCIFTIHITGRETGSATIRKAKLHLVDLAGSERVSKTNAQGTLLTEAKYINLSLHYLEQVIVALAEKNRNHVPYRNSMMTSVLRDSLGGNCMTTMIATCSAEKRNCDESISTCRFAQRVALIKNDALINEELDPKLIINRLKHEISELKNQISMGSGDVDTSELTNSEIEKLKLLVQRYLDDNDIDAPVLNVGADMRKINYCYKLMKESFHSQSKGSGSNNNQNNSNNKSSQQHNNNNGNNSGGGGGGGQPNITIVDASLYDSKETKDLKETLRQRDNEISILVNMLKKEKKKVTDFLKNPSTAKPPMLGSLNESNLNSTFADELTQPKRQILKNMSMGRTEAFEIFKRDYSGNLEIEEQKKYLKRSYTEAKGLGELINTTRAKLNQIKSKSEQLYARLEANNQLNDDMQHPEMEALRKTMEFEKETYRLNFEKLKNLKAQIEHSQHLVERSQVKLQKDFENWWQEQCDSIEAKNQKNLEYENMKKPSTADSISSSMVSSIPTGASLISNSRQSMNLNSTLNSANSTGQHTQMDKYYDVSNKPRMLPYIESDGLKNPNGTNNSKISLTGDNQIDADITAFMNARKRIMNSSQKTFSKD